MEDHIQVLLERKSPQYSLKEVRHTMDVLFACYRSSRSGERVTL